MRWFSPFRRPVRLDGILERLLGAGMTLMVSQAVPWNPVSSNAAASDGDRPPLQSATHFQDQIYPALVEHCADCHDPDDESDVVGFLRDRDAESVAANRGLWASVAEQLKNRTMPPADESQPSEAVRLEVADWIETHLDATACGGKPFAGRPVPRRLNRDQYTHAINDLTGMGFDFVEKIPADGSGGEGFDNNGETLFLPTMLMERYLELADEVVDACIAVEPFERVYVVGPRGDDPQFALTIDRGVSADDQRLLTPGQSARTTFRTMVEADFHCSFDIAVKSVEASPAASTAVWVKIDGLEVIRKKFPLPDDAEGPWTTVHLSPGFHQLELGVADSDDSASDDSADGSTTSETGVETARFRVKHLHVRQNPAAGFDADKQARATERLFAPAGDLIERDPPLAARKILERFLRRAWRRTPTSDELDGLLTLFDRSIQRDGSFAHAIKLPLKAGLVSPKFLFVAEAEATASVSGMRRISDVELASRLSLFLWHSIPDHTLIDLAEANRLHHPKVLRGQVRRMLKDWRAARFAHTFSGQWLGTNAVGNTRIPDVNFYRPVYTSELVSDLRDQVGHTMRWMLQNDRPITDWIDADYVIVNRRLAKHYGIKYPKAAKGGFRKVTLANHPRTGVLGLGAVHMLTSYARRTSPVLRGGWVLETIFGTRLPAPPPDAGQLPGGESESDKRTVRERLQKHRENPTCAACHDIMDPIGFALENFDVLGRWRDKEGEFPVDASGELPSGETFDGPIELRAVLKNRQDEFIEEFCHRMLGYALGRSLEDADACTVDRIVHRVRQADDRLDALVLALVQSDAFQHRDVLVSTDPTTASQPHSTIPR